MRLCGLYLDHKDVGEDEFSIGSLSEGRFIQLLRALTITVSLGEAIIVIVFLLTMDSLRRAWRRRNQVMQAVNVKP